MSKKEAFIAAIEQGYTFQGPSMILGGAMIDGECQTNSLIKLPLKTFNRHGLIAGATGSGKTKTLQILAEQLSKEGVPSLLMDIKGDLSGIAVPSAGHVKIDQRHEKIGIPFTAGKSPVEFLTLSEQKGARLRATVSEFGPVLFSKMMDLTEAQSGIISVVFKFCDDHGLPLLDLKDLKQVLNHIANEGKDVFKAEYGMVNTTSLGTILRKIVELEQQGAEIFFGEPSFEVDDLCRIDANGRGIVSVVRLVDVQDRPKLFSTFMLQLLAEIYANFPEEGDLERPKLVIFIDEAHLVFNEASKALLNQIESIIKLIRSKGVGIFFVTQNPVDIPEAVLGQLGMKIQHSLRAFTAKDRQAIKLAAQNYPETEFYAVDQLLTELGIGEALVTALNEKGIPTPLAHTLLRAPESRMDVLTEDELDGIVKQSKIATKYNKVVDRESAYEILTEKLAAANEAKEVEETKTSTKTTTAKKEKGTLETILTSSTTRSIGNTFMREVTRGLLGALGIRTPSSRSKKKTGFW